MTTALDLLFPPLCVNCDRVGSFLCPHCLAKMTPAPSRTLPEFDEVRVCANYAAPVSTAIHALKYQGQTRIAETLGLLLCQALENTQWPVEMVSAVPLHPNRLRERGYNQAALLAHYLAQTHHWPFVPDAVQRVRETASQVHLNARERQDNVAEAFSADPGRVSGKSVLLVDDVLTTGATLSACAAALRAAGAVRVYGVTVAGAMVQDQQASVPGTLVEVV
ncbi:MAG: ComF family protein [Chloroflexi bacterium]|nr:ComF family protein [Chloroflexota bacterium]